MKRIAVNTGGGDAPGLNAVIRAVVLASRTRGWEVFGIRRGYEGLFVDGGIVQLSGESVRGITHTGGTILGTTNRGSPLASPVTLPDGTLTTVDRSDEIIDAFQAQRFDGLIAIAGRGPPHRPSNL